MLACGDYIIKISVSLSFRMSVSELSWKLDPDLFTADWHLFSRRAPTVSSRRDLLFYTSQETNAAVLDNTQMHQIPQFQIGC